MRPRSGRILCVRHVLQELNPGVRAVEPRHIYAPVLPPAAVDGEEKVSFIGQECRKRYLRIASGRIQPHQDFSLSARGWDSKDLGTAAGAAAEQDCAFPIPRAADQEGGFADRLWRPTGDVDFL